MIIGAIRWDAAETFVSPWLMLVAGAVIFGWVGRRVGASAVGWAIGGGLTTFILGSLACGLADGLALPYSYPVRSICQVYALSASLALTLAAAAAILVLANILRRVKLLE